ncbi:MAG: PilZ domain-containing protein [Candidatus Omnitrophota bacterium]
MIKKEFLYLGWYFLLCIPVIILYVNFSIKAKREWLSLIGRIRPQEISDEQKREYIRLESAFPVEFQNLAPSENGEPQIYQGFTRDVSKNGLCVETFTVRGKKMEGLTPNETKLRLIINIPSESESTVAQGTIRWINKTEDMTVDRYTMGISFDDIAKPDLENIMKHVLWFRRKPNILGIVVALVFMLLATFFSMIIVLKEEKSDLEKKVRMAREGKATLTSVNEEFKRERDEYQRRIDELSQERTVLMTRLRSAESRISATAVSAARAQAERAKVQIKEDEIEEEPESVLMEEAEEVFLLGPEEEEAALEESEEFLEPVVELRSPSVDPGEELVAPNVTRSMVESEQDIYRTLRNYILTDETHLLDRYCSTHKRSIYHAASLFALAEMRYKNGSMKEMTLNAYRDVIKLYSRSKYASYASHRIEQVDRNLPYGMRTLKYYAQNYNLPPLFDYRELEPYKK